MNRTLTFPLLALAAAACASAQEAPDPFLRWMNSIAQRELDARAEAVARVRTAADAERRKADVREKILSSLGGLPDYTGPLNAQITGAIERPGYVIEKLYFESLPRLFVTANLYRPASPGRHPAVLLPLGHWEEGKPAVQNIAGNLALKGFVVLVYDPIGQGERTQAYDPRIETSLAGQSVSQHWMAGAQALLIGQSFARHRIWDAKRALDYLTSRPEVDAERIGATGCSGGGTLTTYVSALDPRVKAAAPACFITSFRELFSGSVGDSEQSLPNFISSGLDQADYIELFAPKPWLISSTLGDFFPLEGTRQTYAEAQRWYALYNARDKIAWAIGHGEHGTPVEIRERIYEWFIRWLAGGKGDPAEQPVGILPEHDLWVTATGQVSTSLKSRDVFEVIREDYGRLKAREQGGLVEALQGFSQAPPQDSPEVRTISETRTADLIIQKIEFETEPGLPLSATLVVPRPAARKPGVVMVETNESPSAAAVEMARAGAVVLSLYPRGKPAQDARPFAGDWQGNTRAWLIGRSLPGLRAFDIRRGIDVLAARSDVDSSRLRAAAHGVAGVWVLMAAALDKRIGGVWVDRTPASLASALDSPVHRDLHDAVLVGFLRHWDLADIAKLVAPRQVLWTDPTDWLGQVRQLGTGYIYRPWGGPNTPYIQALLK